MALFSERYGYVKPKEVFIREDMPEEMQNAICSGLDELRSLMYSHMGYGGVDIYESLESHIWVFFLNQRKSDFRRSGNLIQEYIKDEDNLWYKKLDIIEAVIKRLEGMVGRREISPNLMSDFKRYLNVRFSQLYYGYRIVENCITEITSDEEIATIERAIADNKDNIREHLNNALALLAKRPEADYRNSIKESISAVEAYCRKLTGTDTLGKALSAIQKTSTPIPDVLKSAFVGLYTYTNSEETGIRHALMDDSGTYTPSLAEAQFMLVSCSAFLNYLKM